MNEAAGIDAGADADADVYHPATIGVYCRVVGYLVLYVGAAAARKHRQDLRLVSFFCCFWDCVCATRSLSWSWYVSYGVIVHLQLGLDTVWPCKYFSLTTSGNLLTPPREIPKTLNVPCSKAASSTPTKQRVIDRFVFCHAQADRVASWRSTGDESTGLGSDGVTIGRFARRTKCVFCAANRAVVNQRAHGFASTWEVTYPTASMLTDFLFFNIREVTHVIHLWLLLLFLLLLYVGLVLAWLHEQQASFLDVDDLQRV